MAEGKRKALGASRSTRKRDEAEDRMSANTERLAERPSTKSSKNVAKPGSREDLDRGVTRARARSGDEPARPLPIDRDGVYREALGGSRYSDMENRLNADGTWEYDPDLPPRDPGVDYGELRGKGGEIVPYPRDARGVRPNLEKGADERRTERGRRFVVEESERGRTARPLPRLKPEARGEAGRMGDEVRRRGLGASGEQVSGEGGGSMERRLYDLRVENAVNKDGYGQDGEIAGTKSAPSDYDNGSRFGKKYQVDTKPLSADQFNAGRRYWETLIRNYKTLQNQKAPPDLLNAKRAEVKAYLRDIDPSMTNAKINEYIDEYASRMATPIRGGEMLPLVDDPPAIPGLTAEASNELIEKRVTADKLKLVETLIRENKITEAMKVSKPITISQIISEGNLDPKSKFTKSLLKDGIIDDDDLKWIEKSWAEKFNDASNDKRTSLGKASAEAEEARIDSAIEELNKNDMAEKQKAKKPPRGSAKASKIIDDGFDALPDGPAPDLTDQLLRPQPSAADPDKAPTVSKADALKDVSAQLADAKAKLARAAADKDMAEFVPVYEKNVSDLEARVANLGGKPESVKPAAASAPKAPAAAAPKASKPLGAPAAVDVLTDADLADVGMEAATEMEVYRSGSGGQVETPAQAKQGAARMKGARFDDTGVGPETPAQAAAQKKALGKARYTDMVDVPPGNDKLAETLTEIKEQLAELKEGTPAKADAQPPAATPPAEPAGPTASAPQPSKAKAIGASRSTRRNAPAPAAEAPPPAAPRAAPAAEPKATATDADAKMAARLNGQRFEDMPQMEGETRAPISQGGTIADDLKALVKRWGPQNVAAAFQSAAMEGARRLAATAGGTATGAIAAGGAGLVRELATPAGAGMAVAEIAGTAGGRALWNAVGPETQGAITRAGAPVREAFDRAGQFVDDRIQGVMASRSIPAAAAALVNGRPQFAAAAPSRGPAPPIAGADLPYGVQGTDPAVYDQGGYQGGPPVPVRGTEPAVYDQGGYQGGPPAMAPRPQGTPQPAPAAARPQQPRQAAPAPQRAERGISAYDVQAIAQAADNGEPYAIEILRQWTGGQASNSRELQAMMMRSRTPNYGG